MTRNSVATSRSRRCIASTSARKASTMSASATSYRSTRCSVISLSNRSKGPSKTSVWTSYATRARLPATCTLGSDPSDVGTSAQERARYPAAHATGLLWGPVVRCAACRQLLRRVSSVGGRPVHRRLVLLRRRPPRPHGRARPGPASEPHARDGVVALRDRARPRRLHRVRPEPRARAHRAVVAARVHRHRSASCGG